MEDDVDSVQGGGPPRRRSSKLDDLVGNLVRRLTAHRVSDASCASATLHSYEDRIDLEQLQILKTAFEEKTATTARRSLFAIGAQLSRERLMTPLSSGSRTSVGFDAPQSPEQEPRTPQSQASSVPSPFRSPEPPIRALRELNEDEFVEEFSQVLDGEVTCDLLRQWFRCIDANCRRRLSWDDFSTCVLLESQRRLLKDTCMTEYIPQPSGSVTRQPASHHTDTISTILCHPRNSHYYTFSRDGTVRSWRNEGTTGLTFERVLYNGDAWITDACFMRGAQRMLFCSSDRRLVVLDHSNGEIVRTFHGRKHCRAEVRESVRVRDVNDKRKFGVALDLERIGNGGPPATRQELANWKNFEECKQQMKQMHREHMKKTVEVTTLQDLTEGPTALEYFCSEGGQELVLLGLRDGCMQLYNISSALCGLRVTLPLTAKYRAHSRPDLRQDDGGQAIYRDNQAPSLDGADNAITKIRVAKHLQAALTASWDGTVKITNIETGKLVRDLTGHTKSVFTLDWSEAQKIIATCGSERHVLIWNPFMKKPIFSLEGHMSPLMGVQFNDLDNQIITVGYDRCCKIWDVRTFRCIQTLNIGDMPLGGRASSGGFALNYDYKDHSIVLGGTYPTCFMMKRGLTGLSTTYEGHSLPVVDTLIGTGGRLVSADAETVIVWDVATGQRLFTFDAASGMPKAHARITSMSLDDTGRRLLAGTHNGAMIMWNYANGQPLHEYKAAKVDPSADTDSEPGERDPDALPRDPDTDASTHDEIRLATQYGDADCPPASRTVLAIKGKAGKIACYANHSDFTVFEQCSWDVKDGAQTLCWAKLGKYLLLGTDCGSICVFNADTLKFEGRPLRAATSPSVQRLTSLLQGGALRRGKYGVVALALLTGRGDPTLLAACTSDGYLELWDTRRRMIVHLSRLVAGALSPRHAHHVAEGIGIDSDENLNMKTPQIAAICADNHHHRILIAHATGSVKVIDLASFDLEAKPMHPPPAMTFTAHPGGRIVSIQYSSKHNLVITGGGDCSIRVHTPAGAYVGMLGVHVYNLRDPGTWQSCDETATAPSTPPALDEFEHELEVSVCGSVSGARMRLGGMGRQRSGGPGGAGGASGGGLGVTTTPRSVSVSISMRASPMRDRSIDRLSLAGSEYGGGDLGRSASICSYISAPPDMPPPTANAANAARVKSCFIPKLSHKPSRMYSLVPQGAHGHGHGGASTDRPCTQHRSLGRSGGGSVSRDGAATARAPRPPRGRSCGTRGSVTVLEDTRCGIGDPDPRKLLAEFEYTECERREKEASFRPTRMEALEPVLLPDLFPSTGGAVGEACRTEASGSPDASVRVDPEGSPTSHDAAAAVAAAATTAVAVDDRLKASSGSGGEGDVFSASIRLHTSTPRGRGRCVAVYEQPPPPGAVGGGPRGGQPPPAKAPHLSSPPAGGAGGGWGSRAVSLDSATSLLTTRDGAAGAGARNNRSSSPRIDSGGGGGDGAIDSPPSPQHGLSMHVIEERIAKLHRSGFTPRRQKRDRSSRMTLQQVMIHKDLRETTALSSKEKQAASFVDSVWNTLPCPAPRDTPAGLLRTATVRPDYKKLRAAREHMQERGESPAHAHSHHGNQGSNAPEMPKTRVKWTNEDLRAHAAR